MDIEQIAFEYARLPIQPTADARAAWNELGGYAVSIGAHLREQFDVGDVAGQPYADADELFADMDNGLFGVSWEAADHPIWTRAVNVAFRLWHDWAHWRVRGDFSDAGEIAAYQRQLRDCRHLSANARAALFTEVIGQLAMTRVLTDRAGVLTFAVQKCGLLPSAR